jgi:hypothetical protein
MLCRVEIGEVAGPRHRWVGPIRVRKRGSAARGASAETGTSAAPLRQWVGEFFQEAADDLKARFPEH